VLIYSCYFSKERKKKKRNGIKEMSRDIISARCQMRHAFGRNGENRSRNEREERRPWYQGELDLHPIYSGSAHFPSFALWWAPWDHIPSGFHGASRVIARVWLPLISDNRAVLMPRSCGYFPRLWWPNIRHISLLTNHVNFLLQSLNVARIRERGDIRLAARTLSIWPALMPDEKKNE